MNLAIFVNIHHDTYIMMTRTQLSFEREMLRQARRRADDRGISLAEYVRRLVAADLDGDEALADPSAIFNLGRSQVSHIARQRDSMVARAYRGSQ